MTLDPLLNAAPLIQFHAGSALLAIALGPVAIHRARRDRLHKAVGYVWVLAMLSVALSAFLIPSFGLAVVGHLGPIHLLAMLALVSLWQGMRAILRGDVRAHRLAMRGLYYQGLAIAGLVNFLPGRRVNRAVFPEHPELGLVVIGLGLGALFWFRWRKDWGARRPA